MVAGNRISLACVLPMKIDKSEEVAVGTKLTKLLAGCLNNDRKSQKELYKHFFGYAMSVCLRYTKNRDEATEVLNEGFLKVFTKLRLYDPDKSLKSWIRRIMINTAIDYYRANKGHKESSEQLENALLVSTRESAISNLSYNEIICEIQQLTPAYRSVFNLYVIDGFNHEEIAGKLDISVGTSKSNLSRARGILQKRLEKLYHYGEIRC